LLLQKLCHLCYPCLWFWREDHIDPSQRIVTLQHSGLDMARAADVFDGSTPSVEDIRINYGETRWITIGCLDRRMVVPVWTERPGEHRIIGMRKANEREQAIYSARLG
jgi:uncharacterized DUF497 family protein